MPEIQLNLVELKKLDLSFPYISKDEIMNCFNIKSTTYDKYRNKFKEKIDEKFYPSGCYLKIGQEQFMRGYILLLIMIISKIKD